jgi:hypothetical protein
MHETARRTKQRCGQVFRHAIGLGIDCRDVTPDLRGLLEPPTVRRHASLTNPSDVGRLLVAIDQYDGRPTAEFALQLAPLVFVRPSELRQASGARSTSKQSCGQGIPWTPDKGRIVCSWESRE